MLREVLLQAARDRRGVSAVVFGVSAIMIAMAIGLVTDYANYTYLRTQLETAADAGVLVAVTTAATQLGPNPTTYLTLGQTAGQTRFTAQTGRMSEQADVPGDIASPTFTVSVNKTGTLITGKLQWSTTYTPFFGALFNVSSMQMSGVSSSSMGVSTPYVNLYIVMDDSPSMSIGASSTDIANMQMMVPCSASGVWSWTGTEYKQAAIASGMPYSQYTCSGTEGTYDGPLSCPFPAGSPYAFSTFTTTGSTPTCAGILTETNGRIPIVGAPCAFACHFDSTHTAGTGTDYYALARGSIGKSFQVTLRMDVVKKSINQLIKDMKNGNTQNSINTAIFTLDSDITKIYPASGDAGNDWTSAASAVGLPPTEAYGPDTGVQPLLVGDSDYKTDFATSLTNLAGELTAAGGGTSAADPQKVLILITDGVQDKWSNGQQSLSALDPSYCEPFKAMGYTVFVLYTPYYPLMVQTYLNSMKDFVEGSGAGSLAYNLQQCATDPNSGYREANDLSSIETALAGFLQIALQKSAHLTQ